MSNNAMQWYFRLVYIAIMVSRVIHKYLFVFSRLLVCP
jgi:hypothetical protein